MTASSAADRRDRVRQALLADGRADVLLVTHLPNVRYLTGFSGSNAVLAVAADGGDVFATDGRYAVQAADQVPDLAAVLDRRTLSAVCARLGAARVAIEATASVGTARMVDDAVGGHVVITSLVEGLRAIKDAGELAVLERACAITSTAFDVLAGELRVGMREVDAARRLESLFGELGAPDRSFATIVGSGPNSAVPHHEPGARALQPGDLLVVDAGALLDGYHADMTRTYVVAQPAPWQVQVHDVVSRAQAAARSNYRPGADCRGLDAVARSVIAEAGFGDRFGHGLGHGVGLEIHEPPFLGEHATGTIAAGMAITVEPGVYLPGRGGVRIEDTLVVTTAGPRVLTPAGRELRVVG